MHLTSARPGGNVLEQAKKESERAGYNMAEKENINSRPSVYEAVVNRWIMDYSFHLAVELFQKHKHADFVEVGNVLSSK